MWTIPKNAREEIRVELAEYNGADILNSRVWFKADDGEYRPSRKGVAFSIAALPAYLAAIEAAHAEAVRRGHLQEGAA